MLWCRRTTKECTTVEEEQNLYKTLVRVLSHTVAMAPTKGVYFEHCVIDTVKGRGVQCLQRPLGLLFSSLLVFSNWPALSSYSKLESDVCEIYV